jgi:hypothetical protein
LAPPISSKRRPYLLNDPFLQLSIHSPLFLSPQVKTQRMRTNYKEKGRERKNEEEGVTKLHHLKEQMRPSSPSPSPILGDLKKPIFILL